MSKGTGVNKELDDEEQNQDLANGVLDADDGIVGTSEDNDSSKNLVWDFDDDIGNEEGLP